MKRTMGGAALLAAMMAIAPLQADAQMGSRGWRGQTDGPRGPGIEMIMRQRAELELTDAQVSQLDQIRQEAVQRRSSHRAVVADLRSKVRAGDLEAADFREQVQALRDGSEAARTQEKERIDAVLNDAQKGKLDEWAGQAQAFRMGRMSAMRGNRAPRGQRSFRGGPGAAGACDSAWGPGPDRRFDFRRGPGGGQGFGPGGLPPR